MSYQLSQKDKKTLELFSMYIQAYGVKTALFDVNINTDYEIDYYSTDWYSKETSLRIPGYDDINNFIETIINEIKDEIFEHFYDEDSGHLTIVINAVEKELTFILNIYKMEVQYETLHRSFNNVDEQTLEYLNDLAKEYENGVVHYEGSGDSGYIESKITLDGESSEDFPSFMETYLYGLLDYFGGWEINEGSQGNIYFNFEKKEITVEHGSNYEGVEKIKVPLRYKF